MKALRSAVQWAGYRLCWFLIRRLYTCDGRPGGSRCCRCGGTDIEWKAHIRPNEGVIEWTADDPDDVWCHDCDDWGVGSVPAAEYDAWRQRALARGEL